jgi:molybdate transport repressor ModE-like protein
MSKPKPAFKLWLETEEGFVFGPGVEALLRKVIEKGTLKEAASSLGMSYRFAWGLVKKVEEKIGEPLIKAHKGGRSGGGRTEITPLGQQFIEDFRAIKTKLSTQILEELNEKKDWIPANIISIDVDSGNIELEISSNRNQIQNYQKGDIVHVRLKRD